MKTQIWDSLCGTIQVLELPQKEASVQQSPRFCLAFSHLPCFPYSLLLGVLPHRSLERETQLQNLLSENLT